MGASGISDISSSAVDTLHNGNGLPKWYRLHRSLFLFINFAVDPLHKGNGV